MDLRQMMMLGRRLMAKLKFQHSNADSSLHFHQAPSGSILNAHLDPELVLTLSSPPQMVLSVMYEHVEGTVEVGVMLELPAQAAAYLPVAPLLGVHLEAVQVVK